MSGSVSERGAEVASVLALGSNLGDRRATIESALAEIDGHACVRLVATSQLYETVAVKATGIDPDAPRYLNAVAIVQTSLEPRALLRALNEIESRHGRVREERWGDRTLDLDIITYGELVLHDESLTLPHPRAFERDFVLAPWLEIDPFARLPLRGAVVELLRETSNTVRPTTSELA